MKIIKTEKGCLSLLGGKTDMGKSTIACYDCADQLRAGKNVMFFSCEYCQSIIYNKLVVHFGLKYQDLFKLNVVDSASWNLDMIKAAIKAAKGTVEVVYIDFLDLLAKTTDSHYDAYTVAQKIDLKQRMLDELAQIAVDQELQIVVLARVHATLDLNMTIEYLNTLTSLIHSPAPAIKMFIGKDEALNPIIKGSDMSHIIEIDGNQLIHFSSINLKEAYRNN